MASRQPPTTHAIGRTAGAHAGTDSHTIAAPGVGETCRDRRVFRVGFLPDRITLKLMVRDLN
jgi:hypothetical protein